MTPDAPAPVFIVTYAQRDVTERPVRVRIERPLVVRSVETVPDGMDAIVFRRERAR